MSSFVHRWLETLEELGVGARSLGLLLAGILDSSLLSLPEINDALLFYLSALTPASAPLFVLAATVGSLGGALLLNRIASWKGPDYIAKLLSGERSDLGLRLYRRYGAWTLFVPAVLPPPCPFKIFVLSSGAFGLPLPQFVLAVAAGRSLRYSLGALLAIRYGDQTLELMMLYGPYVLGVLVLAGGVALALASRRKPSTERPKISRRIVAGSGTATAPNA